MICSSGSRRPGRRYRLPPPSPTHSSSSGSIGLQADLNQSVENARQEVSQAADTARTKWAQLKADAAAKMSDVKANIDKRTREMDAKVAADDADWAEADAAEALDFADWAVENAQLTMLGAVHARAYADKLAKAAANS